MLHATWYGCRIPSDKGKMTGWLLLRCRQWTHGNFAHPWKENSINGQSTWQLNEGPRHMLPCALQVGHYIWWSETSPCENPSFLAQDRVRKLSGSFKFYDLVLWVEYKDWWVRAWKSCTIFWLDEWSEFYFNVIDRSYFAIARHSMSRQRKEKWMAWGLTSVPSYRMSKHGQEEDGWNSISGDGDRIFF